MKSIFKLIITLTIICAVAAIALSFVHQITLKPIAYQKRMEKVRALKRVLPAYDNHPEKDILKVPGENGKPIEVNLAKKGGKVIAVAYRVVSHKGYGGDISLLMGLDMKGKITGIEILGMMETPGLGARIEEPAFKKQFVGRTLKNTKWAVKKDGGDIDQITGATISPRAVTEAIYGGLQLFEKKIRPALKSKGLVQ
ncbi:MAG: RnfABCDGE type electron transport complex subunit G [Deltaproteobacteria bacterium]|nr:RnfABCDGE type electron transport complex subunit G [Deltaproteobacteria bacterium]